MAKSNIELHDKAQEILSLIPPEEFVRLVEVVHELQNNLQNIDDVENIHTSVFGENTEYHRQQLTKTAICLSYMADHFALMLGKITKKCPKYWSEQEEIERKIEENFRDGRPIC